MQEFGGQVGLGDYTSRNSLALDEFRRLLQANEMPFEDLELNRLCFLLAWHDQKAIGCIGLEVHGISALVRSLCVAENWRNLGIGRRLVLRMIAKSQSIGVLELYLLTTQKKTFFERFGFVLVPRSDAPLAIAQTKQFTSICPSSATAMKLGVTGFFGR